MRCRNMPFTIFLYVTFFLSSQTSRPDKDPLSGFESFEIIHPKVISQFSRYKRDLKSSQEEYMKSEELCVEFQAFQKTFNLELTKNQELFAPHYQEMYQDKNGRYITRTNVIQLESNCHYSGKLKGHENSWLSINICHGLNGLIFDGRESFHLHYYENMSEVVNLISKASETKPLNVSCGNGDLPYKWDINGHRTSHRFRRFSEWQFSHLGQNRRILELFIVADRSMFLKYRSQTESVSRRVREIMNIVHGLYIQLNIVVVLVGLQLWSERDEAEVSSEASRTLDQFSVRGNAIIREYHCDDVQLITAVKFRKPTVGLAFVGTICRPQSAMGVNEDYTPLVTSVATTIAHEIGHNFNMTHDDASCKCPSGNCIMGSRNSAREDFQWSSCSIEALTNYLKDGTDVCLKNLPKQTVLPVCGDGVVQHGEQCDCGQPKICDNPCCNSTTCQLYENATCAAGSCCDLKACKIKEVSTTCRETQLECDLPEFCDGKSPICPDDVFVQDGTECGNGKAFCFQGGCQSHDDQCHLLWGYDVQSSESCCYEFNKKGRETENCGQDASRKHFHACQSEDVLCGFLKCDLTQHEKQKLKYGGKAGKEGSWTYRTCRSTRQLMSNCFSYSINFGLLTVDPGFVPSGAKCEENKMCFKHKCVEVETVRKPKCPNDCSGNGICNSKGNCHCIIGFGSSACDYPGPGGSITSGPPSDPDAGRTYVTVMYVIFFGVCPLVLTTASAIYFFCFLAPKIASMERCKQEQPTKRKASSFRASIKRLRKLSLKSVSEDVSYDSFSSSDEGTTTTDFAVKPLPAIPTNPPRVNVLRRNKAPTLAVKIRTPMKPATKDSSVTARKTSHPVSQMSRKVSQRSIHEGIILKVPGSEATSKGDTSVSERQFEHWSDQSQHQQGVSMLAKLFEKK